MARRTEHRTTETDPAKLRERELARTLAKVQRYVNSMGRTSTEVAQHLRERRIVGLRSTTLNPVVRAIYKKVPTFIRGLKTIKTSGYSGINGLWSFAATFVDNEINTYNLSGYQYPSKAAPKLPQAVQNFIGEFLAGAWWDLREDVDDPIPCPYE